MAIYKTKVKEIEAIRWLGTEESMREIIEFTGVNNVMWQPSPNILTIIPEYCSQLDLHFKDWVIKTHYGSIEVCKSEMFDIYYEKS